MAEFNAAHTMADVRERVEEAEQGNRLVPILAAIFAVFAALATLFANHSSTTALATKNEAILNMSKAADQYNYYESKRIKVQLNQALINAGLVTNAEGLKKMQGVIKSEDDAAKNQILPLAKRLQQTSNDDYERAERTMRGYEKFEVAATLFEVSVVLVSITALAGTRVFLYIAGGATLAGIIFFVQGSLLR